MDRETPIFEPHVAVDAEPLPEENPRRVQNRKKFSFLDALLMLADHRRVIFWITALCTLLSIPIALLLPARYTATVTLLPPEQSSSLGAMLASELSSMGGSSGGASMGGIAALAGNGLGLTNPNDRYVGMLRSRVVEDAVIQRFGLQKQYRSKLLSEARKEFESHVKVDGNNKDGLIHISVEDRDPRRAQQIANGYVDQFRDLSQNLAVTEASQRRIFFEQQLELAKDKLGDAEEAMKQTELSTGILEPNTQAAALISSVASLRAQISVQEMMIQGMQTYATQQNSRLAQARQELESLRSQLAALGGSENSGDSLILPKGLVPKEGLEYLRHLRDVKYYEAIFEVLARQYELAKLDEAREGAIVQVVDPALVPDKRSSPHRAFIVLGSFFGGFLLAVLVAFGMGFFERMEENPESSAKLHRLYGALRPRRRTAHSQPA